MKKLYLIFTALFALMLASCTAQTTVDNSDKPRVYASFYAMYDFARMIGGDNIALECMVPSGVEPHDWEPSASDIAKLEKADVFIYSGSAMEHWTDSVLPTLSNKNLRIIAMSDYVSEIDESDPHIWLSPDNVGAFLEGLKNAFCEADSDNAPLYAENCTQYTQKARELSERLTAAANGFHTHDIVVSHEAYGYLCKLMNINQLALEGLTGESDPTPSKMAELIRTIKDKDIKYIFTEPGQSTKTIDTVAAETGAVVLELNPFEFDEENRDYFAVMEENLDALKTALD